MQEIINVKRIIKTNKNHTTQIIYSIKEINELKRIILDQYNHKV